MIYNGNIFLEKNEMINLKEKVLQAVLKNDIAELDSLSLNPKFDVNGFLVANERYIMHACMNTSEAKTLLWLIERGAEINCQNQYGLSPLIVASIHGNVDAIKILIDHDANLEHQYFPTRAKPDLIKTALLVAIEKEEFEIIQLLVFHGAKVDDLKFSNSEKDQYIKTIINATLEKLNLDKTLEVSKNNKSNLQNKLKL